MPRYVRANGTVHRARGAPTEIHPFVGAATPRYVRTNGNVYCAWALPPALKISRRRPARAEPFAIRYALSDIPP